MGDAWRCWEGRLTSIFLREVRLKSRFVIGLRRLRLAGDKSSGITLARSRPVNVDR